MKISLAIFCSLCSTVYSQVDSSILDYFPLQKGNLWQYRYRSFSGGAGLLENMISYGDTTMPNGLRYVKAERAPFSEGLKFYRIDTLFRVQEYDTSYGDTCGGLNDEVNFFRLNEPDSSIWAICENVGDDLLYPLQLRYLGEQNLQEFGEVRNVKIFRRYVKRVHFGDTLEFYGKTFMLMKGVGIYYTERGEDGSSILEGAIINGVKYGNVVGVVNEEVDPSSDFSLQQNYPNPFNTGTIVTFSIDAPRHVILEVCNTLGEVISILEDGILDSGIHVRKYNTTSLPTGVYYVRLRSNHQFAVRKMLYIK